MRNVRGGGGAGGGVRRIRDPSTLHRLLLRKLGVGLLAVLNAVSKGRYGVDFPTLLLEDEEKALEVLEDVRGVTLIDYFERHIIPLIEPERGRAERGADVS